MVQINNMEQTPRRPRTSALIGQAIGGAFEAAGSKYLQGKMGEMFQNRQDERNFAIQKRSAEGIAELYPEEYRPFVIQAGSVLPIEQHSKLAETGLDFLQGRFNSEKNGLKKPKGGGTPSPSPSQPLNTSQQQNYQPPYQPRSNQALNPTDEAKSLAASQRQGMGSVPMPGYPQTYNAQQPFIPNQQQYQPVGGMPNAMQTSTQIPQRIMAGGQISPEPISNQMQQEGQETGPRERLIPPVEQQVQQEQEGPKRLADMTEEEFQDYISGMPYSMQEKEKKARLEDKRDKRDEIKTEQGREKINLSKESLSLKKEESQQKWNAPTKEDRKFVENVDKIGKTAEEANSSLDEIERIVNEGHLGGDWPFSPSSITKGITPTSREQRALLTQNGVHLFSLVKEKLFHQRLTDTDFKAIDKNWVVTSADSAPVARGKIKGLRTMLSQALKTQEALSEIQNPDGSYPKNTMGRVNKLLKDQNGQLKELVRSRPQPVYEGSKVKEPNIYSVDKMPSAKDLEEGTEADLPDGSTHRVINGAWKKVK